MNHVGRKYKVLRLIVLISIVGACTAAVSQRWRKATNPHLSFGEWEDSRVWWQHGECIECHREQLDNETNNIHMAGKKPVSHKEIGWLQSHGRSKLTSESRCMVCHSTTECKSCHDHPPATHTTDFMRPSCDSIDANRHTLLARLRPSSCLVCHDNFVSKCSDCHAPGEVHDWQQQGLKDLGDWVKLLESDGNHPQKPTAQH